MVSSTFLEAGKLATDGDWPKILKLANIENVKSQTTDSENEVTVTGDDLWELEFSSKSNVAVFETPRVATKGYAWVGDELDCSYIILIFHL